MNKYSIKRAPWTVLFTAELQSEEVVGEVWTYDLKTSLHIYI